MKTRTIVVIIMAVVFGVSLAVGVTQLRGSGATTVEADTVPVVVAVRDIPRGGKLTAEHVRLQPWPKKLVPERALTAVEDAVDRVVAYPLLATEPVMGTKLAAKGSGRGLAALVKPGMRAYTIQTSKAASNVAGFILPGNKVDVLMSLRGGHSEDNGGGSSQTLLQCVMIIAVDQRLDAPAENKVDPKELSSVTLEVTPKQAAMLDLGQANGQLTLALRNPFDEEAPTSEATKATLASIQGHLAKQPAAPKIAERPAVVKVAEPQPTVPDMSYIVTMRGSQRDMVTVEYHR